MSQEESHGQNPKPLPVPVVAASGPPKVTSTKATEPVDVTRESRSEHFTAYAVYSY